MTEKTGKSLISAELKLRIISAVVLAVVVLLITWIGGKTFALLWALVAVLIFKEFTSITKASSSMRVRAVGFGFLILVLIAAFIEERTTSLYLLLGGTLLVVIWEWILNRSIWTGVGLIYAALPFFAMSEMRDDTFAGMVLVLIVFACVWGADVLAYFSGKAIGGPKLAPRISPKKTWAGFIGAVVGGIGLSVLVVSIFKEPPNAVFLLLMAGLAVLSQLGDLLESVLKRKFDVKDSSNLIPGHGGILDRADGLIVVAVGLWLALIFYHVRLSEQETLADVFARAFL